MSVGTVIRLHERREKKARCARSGCGAATSSWDPERRLCAACALERDLFERDRRCTLGDAAGPRTSRPG